MFHNLYNSFHEVSYIMPYHLSSILTLSPPAGLELALSQCQESMVSCGLAALWLPSPFPRLHISSQFLSVSDYLAHCFVAIYSLDSQVPPRSHMHCCIPTPRTCYIWHFSGYSGNISQVKETLFHGTGFCVNESFITLFTSPSLCLNPKSKLFFSAFVIEEEFSFKRLISSLFYFCKHAYCIDCTRNWLKTHPSFLFDMSKLQI